MWGTCPEILKPTFNCEDVLERWRKNIGTDEIDVRRSDDPGYFLCAFIYFASMAWFWKRQEKERPVMFLHVPQETTEEALERGTKTAFRGGMVAIGCGPRTVESDTLRKYRVWQTRLSATLCVMKLGV